MQTIGERIKEVRQARGITQQELADRIGKIQPQVVRWEQATNIKSEMLAKIAGALDVPVSSLLPDAPTPTCARCGKRIILRQEALHLGGRTGPLFCLDCASMHTRECLEILEARP